MMRIINGGQSSPPAGAFGRNETLPMITRRQSQAVMIIVILALMCTSSMALDLTITGVPGNYGTPYPLGYGISTDLVEGVSITNAVPRAVDGDGGMRLLSQGWTLHDGSNLVQSSTETQAVFQLTTNLTLSWLWTNSFRLTIAGVPGNYGTPYPLGYGISTDLVEGVSITNAVPRAVDTGGSGRWLSQGWSLYDGSNLVQSSADTQAVFQLTTNLTLFWLWTNSFRLTSLAGINGGLAADVTGWYTNGTVVPVEAVPTTDCFFMQWTGDLSPEQFRDPTIDLLMDAPRSVMAHFFTSTSVVKRATGQTAWTNDESWMPPGMPGPNDSVWLSVGTNLLADPVWVSDVIVSNGARLKLAGAHTMLNARDVWVLTNGTISCETNDAWPSPDTNRIFIACRNLTINQGGLLDGAYKGWGPTNGPGAGGYASGNDGGGGAVMGEEAGAPTIRAPANVGQSTVQNGNPWIPGAAAAET
jgi:hypothetical protein